MELGSSAFITIDGVSKSFTNREQTQVVLKQISAHIHKGEIISILGESGCGKSTLLNLIGGFEQATEGTVMMDGDLVSRPSRRGVMLFQNYGLHIALGSAWIFLVAGEMVGAQSGLGYLVVDARNSMNLDMVLGCFRSSIGSISRLFERRVEKQWGRSHS